jgi:hypothetical protein
MSRYSPISDAGWNADLCGCGGPKDARAARCRGCYSRLPEHKQCTGCKRSQPLDQFYLRASGRPLQRCKTCVAARRPAARYYRATRSRPGHYRRVAARLMERRRTDPAFKLADNLRRNLRQCIHRHSGSKAAPTLDLLGCSMAEFKAYVEARWQPGMSWANWGRHRDCWQLDHIRPVASFNLHDAAQLRACFHHTNYQPLWALDNAAKGARH